MNTKTEEVVMKCLSCGTHNADDAKFCIKCGSSIDYSIAMKCSICGTQNADDAKFCIKCGSTVGNSKEAIKNSPRNGGRKSTYSSKDIALMIKIGFLIFSTILVVTSLFSNLDFDASSQDLLIFRAGLVSSMSFWFFMPGLFITIPTIRKRIPLFKKHMIGFTILGWIILVILGFGINSFINNFHSDEFVSAKMQYEVELEQQRLESISLREQQESESIALKELEKSESISLREQQESESIALKELEKSESIALREQQESESIALKEQEKSESIALREQQETTINEVEEKLQTQICQDLINTGISEVAALKAFDIIEEIDLPIWKNKEDIVLENSENNDYIFSYTAIDGDFNAIYMFHVLNDDIEEIADGNLDIIYNHDGINHDYAFFRDFDLYQLVEYTKSVVNSSLVAPSTAKYPGSWINPHDDWSFGKNNNVLSISSYVDSQNAFGANIRSSFVVRYMFDGVSYYDLIYFSFSGDVIIDKQ